MAKSKANPEAYSITKPACAARDKYGNPCGGSPTIDCPHCLLVAYCGDACKDADWPQHEPQCTRKHEFDSLKDVADGEQLVMRMHETFWSSYAATDLLNLGQNEGCYFDGRLTVIISGQSPLRHVIATILKVPQTANPALKFCLKPDLSPHLCRDFFALHLLFARQHDPYINAEAVIHLWYSAKMPSILWDHVATVMKEYFEDFEASIEDELRDPDKTNARPKMLPPSGQLGWEHNNIRFKCCLVEDGWQMLRDVLKQKDQISSEGAAIVRALDVQKYGEPLNVAAARMTGSRLLGLCKWRSDGILLPFGHPRDDFDMFNPIFFHGNGTYPNGATAEPLGEWPMELLDIPDCPAQNDVYGKMFYYLRDMLVRFQDESKRLAISITMTSFDLSLLLSHDVVSLVAQFDRIHLGELWDFHPPRTLTVAAVHLKHAHENPFARLLVMTRTPVVCTNEEMEGEIEEESYLTFDPSGTILDDYAPPIDELENCTADALFRRRVGLLMWRNWDKFANRYFYNPKLFAIHLAVDDTTELEQSVFKTGYLGLHYQDKNTITRRWPNRLVHSKKDEPSLRDFNRHVGWFDNIPQRWVEWARTGDANMKDWTNFKNEAMDRPWSYMCELQTRMLEIEPDEAKQEKMARSETGVKDRERLEREALEKLVEDIALENSGAANGPGGSNVAKAKGKKSKRKKSKK